MKTFCSLVLSVAALSATAQERPTTAYVPDKTCPFARESQDPSAQQLLKAVNDNLDALSNRCRGQMKDPIAVFRRAITQLGNDSGVERFATPGAESKGYLGVAVHCANYPDVLRSEFEAALATAQAGSREFPSDDYKKCLTTTDPTSCVRTRYLDKMREQRHRCVMGRENDKWVQQRERYDALAKQVGDSLNTIVTGAEGCADGAGPFVDMALQGLGLFATLSPAFGPYGMGAALGTDLLRSLIDHYGKNGQRLRAAEGVRQRQALDRLACLYLDTLNAAVDCPSRMKDLRDRFLAQSRTNPMPGAAQPAAGPPAGTVALLARVSEVNRVLQNLRASKSDPRRRAQLFSDFSRLVDRTPIDVPWNDKGVSSFKRFDSLRPYLAEAGDWLSTFSEKKLAPDVFMAREVEKQGRQLKKMLTDYDALLNPRLTPAEVTTATNKFFATLEGSAADGEPAIDLEETLMHVLERYDPVYRFTEVATSQLLTSTAPTARPVAGEARDKVVNAFTALVVQLQGSAATYFDDAGAKPHFNPTLTGTSVTHRTQTFDSAIQPLFRSCSLMAGLLYYRADNKGRTPLTNLVGGPNDGWRLEWPFKPETFVNNCKPFFCGSLDQGVLPFHDIQKTGRADYFHEAQCWAMQSYEARLAGARRNYVTTGDPCKAPVEVGAGAVVPVSGVQPVGGGRPVHAVPVGGAKK